MKISVKWQPKISQNKFKMVLWCCFFIVCFYFLLLQRRPRNQSCFTTPSFCIKGVKLSHTGRRKGMRGDDGSHDENYWAVCIIFFPLKFLSRLSLLCQCPGLFNHLASGVRKWFTVHVFLCQCTPRCYWTRAEVFPTPSRWAQGCPTRLEQKLLGLGKDGFRGLIVENCGSDKSIC